MAQNPVGFSAAGILNVILMSSANQAGLAAGAEVSLNITAPPGMVFSGFDPGAVLCVNVQPEANVMYVVEYNGATLSAGNTNLAIKVKNVGSAAGAQQWSVNGFVIRGGSLPGV